MSGSVFVTANSDDKSAGAPAALPVIATVIPLTVTTFETSISSISKLPPSTRARLPSFTVEATSVWAVTVGASFVPVTVTETVRGTIPPCPSKMSKLKVSTNSSPAAKYSTVDAATE